MESYFDKAGSIGHNYSLIQQCFYDYLENAAQSAGLEWCLVAQWRLVCRYLGYKAGMLLVENLIPVKYYFSYVMFTLP